jgi:hypothetical protein
MQTARTVLQQGALRQGVVVLAGVLAMGATPEAFSQTTSGSVWVTPGFYTHHFDRNRELRDANPGLGLEYRLSTDIRLTAGRFINSDNAYSSYLGFYYQPLRFASVQWGTAVGLFNGYPNAFGGGWFPAILPTATWEGRSLGVNVAFIPPLQNRLYGGVSLQIKYRLR